MRDESGSTSLLDADLGEQIKAILPRYPTKQAVVLPAGAAHD
jgi:hypothetical protein